MPIVTADIGVPMIIPQYFLMGIATIPIILVEAFVFCRSMNTEFGAVLPAIAGANFATTVIGVPIAWLIMLLLELVSTGGTGAGINTPVQKLVAVTLQAAWLIPYERELHWMIPAAATVWLIPSFVASVFLEFRVLRNSWKDKDRNTIWRSTIKANVCSYLLLLSIGSAWTYLAMR
jgi:hypothetical protein